MTLEDLVTIMNNRVLTLSEAKRHATSVGDLPQVIQLEGDLLTTLSTLHKLKETTKEP